MPATIRDVALKAGVSPSTVSKAMNDSGAIAEETRQKVLQAAHALDYRPNARARNLLPVPPIRSLSLLSFPMMQHL